jgi:hypothetical protein
MLIATLLFAFSAFAQDKIDARDNRQKKIDELMKSAKEHGSEAVWAIRLSAGLLVCLLLYGAYSICRHGLKITSTKQITGPASYAIAVALVLLAGGVALAGFYYAPALIP